MPKRDLETNPAGAATGSSERSAVSPADWTPCGAHRIRVVDDTFEIELHGAFTDSDLDQYFANAERINAKYGYFLILADISGGVTMSSTVRKRSVGWINKVRPLTALGVIGAPLPARAVVTLAVQAIRIFSRPDYSVEFFKDGPAAREWLANQRQELRQQKQSK